LGGNRVMLNFNEDRFRQDKKAEGYADEEIDMAIKSIKLGQEGTGLQKASEKGQVPYYIGVPAAAIGHKIAGPPGAFVMGTGGYALGNIIEDLTKMKSGTYQKPKDFKEAFNMGIDNLGEAGEFGFQATGVSSVLSLADALLRPTKTREKLSDYRADISKNKSLSHGVVYKQLDDKSKSYATPESRKQAQEISQKLYNFLFPMQGQDDLREIQGPVSQPWESPIKQRGEMSVPELYKRLILWENDPTVKAYEGGQHKIARDLSKTVRGMLAEEGGTAVKVLNKMMSATYAMDDVKDWLLKSFGKKAAFRVLP
jgi:hypothetical protein